MYIFILMVLAILLSGCQVSDVPPVHRVTPRFEPVSHQTKKVRLAIIKNDSNYCFETLIEDIGKGAVILPGKTVVVCIPNIRRPSAQIKIRIIALGNAPGMDCNHFIGEIERSFPIPKSVDDAIPFWIVNNQALK